MICYVLAMGKQHLGPHVIVGYGIKIFFITSPDHLEMSGTIENLTTGCQSEICVLPVLCNVFQIIFHTASTHPHQC